MTRRSGALALMGLGLALAACGREPGEGSAAGGLSAGAPAERGAAGPDSAAGPATASGPVRITGFFLLGPGRRDFQACFSETEVWVDGPALPDLMELQTVLTPGRDPFEAIFVDVLATAGPPPRSGSGSSLAATLEVLEIRRAAFEDWGCREEPADLVVEAWGNEPSWTLRVVGREAQLVLPGEAVRRFAVGELEPSPEGWRLTGTVDGSPGFSLTLALGGCRDSVSGAYAHLGSILTTDGVRREGCAYLGPAGEP